MRKAGKLELWLYDKKAELFIRMALAAENEFAPLPSMGLPERIVYAQISKWGSKIFKRAAAMELLTKERRMAEESCKHDMAGPDSKFCPGCGATLSADPEVEAVVGRIFRKLISEYDVKPKKPAASGAGAGAGAGDGKAKKSLAEKLGVSKK